jgi:hypothetical protein
MWQRGCFPTKTLAWPRRLYRMRDRCAVLRTLLQCVCTQRRNCIGQLSPFSEYAPAALRNKWKPATTIKLIHCRRLGAKSHEPSASGGYLGIQCQKFQSLDATRDWDYRTRRDDHRAFTFQGRERRCRFWSGSWLGCPVRSSGLFGLLKSSKKPPPIHQTEARLIRRYFGYPGRGRTHAAKAH